MGLVEVVVENVVILVCVVVEIVEKVVVLVDRVVELIGILVVVVGRTTGHLKFMTVSVVVGTRYSHREFCEILIDGFVVVDAKYVAVLDPDWASEFLQLVTVSVVVGT